MARRKRRPATYAGQATRDLPKIATPVRLPLKIKKSPLAIGEDRRTVPHDIRHERFVTKFGTPAQISRRPTQSGLRKMRKTGLLPEMFDYFKNARDVPVCVRRENRRRVLFALRKTGRGGRHNRRPHWTAKSYIRCK